MYTLTYRQPQFQKNVNHTFLVHRFRHSQILARLPSFTSLALFCKCEDSILLGSKVISHLPTEREFFFVLQNRGSVKKQESFFKRLPF